MTPDGNRWKVKEDTRRFIFTECPEQKGLAEELLGETSQETTDLQIVPAGGVSNIPRGIKLISEAREFANIEYFCVIRDVEDSPKSAVDSIKGALVRADLPCPSEAYEWVGDADLRVSFAVLPNPQSPGKIEDLCLQAARDTAVYPCVEQFFQCVEGKQGDPPGDEIGRAHV